MKLFGGGEVLAAYVNSPLSSIRLPKVRFWKVAQCRLLARRGQNGSGRACLLRPGSSDVNLFRNGEGVIDLDTEVPDSAFDLGVTEQELHGSQITSTSVDQGCLGPS